MKGMLEHFSRALIGQDPRRIEHIWQMLYRGAYFEGGKITAAVVSAIDIALWDILGKWLGVPVWQLLGRRLPRYHPLLRHPWVAYRSLRSWKGPRSRRGRLEGATLYARHARSGWTGAMARPTTRWPRSMRRSSGWAKSATRSAPDALLSIDFHHRLSPAEAALFCQRVEELNLHFVEEPIRCENPEPTRNCAP